MTGVLSNTRVIEVGAFAPVRLATKWLALLGAEVISIEKPRSRKLGELRLFDDDAHAHWTAYQTNKRSITLDLKTEEGVVLLHDLVRDADVFAEGHAPGTTARIGADEATLRAINPEIVYCSVTGYGQTGPYAGLFGHEANYQAMSGLADLTGTLGGPPMLSGFSAGDRMGGSAMAAMGMLAALLHRQITGKGQFVDAACTQGLIGGSGRRLSDEFFMEGKVSPRGLWAEQDGHPGYGIYKTSDDQYIALSTVEPWGWKKFCTVVGRTDLIGKERDADEQPNIALKKDVADIIGARTRAQWQTLNDEHNLAISPVLSIAEVVGDPHFNEWGLFPEVYHPRLKRNIRQVGMPFKLSETPGVVTSMPLVGEHTDEVLHRLGRTEAEIQSLRKSGVIE